MSVSATHPVFAPFDDIARGDPAPTWLAERIGHAWGLSPSVTDIRMIALSENATFRVAVDGEQGFVVRVHRPGYVDGTRQIEGELAWMTALDEVGVVSVPRVIPCRSGELVTFAADPTGAHWNCVAFTFVPGRVLEGTEDPRPFYRQIGALTARLHDFTAQWALPDGHTRFEWAITDMLGPESRWGDWRSAALTRSDVALLERAEDAARAELSSLPASPPSWGLIHADLRPSNIMVDGDMLTVIDFDDCGYGWLLYDFAAALSFIEHEPFAPELARLWVAGYRSVRPLSDVDLRHANALSMLRRLTMLGWTTTHREDALPHDLWTAQVPGTVEVARSYLASPTWLFDESQA